MLVWSESGSVTAVAAAPNCHIIAKELIDRVDFFEGQPEIRERIDLNGGRPGSNPRPPT
jgi:hypothetical protein